MIIHIVIQNRLYPELELGLIFKPAIEIVVIDITESIFKLALLAKQETFMLKAKNLLNDEKNPITNRTV
jgi:hypothetical protein